MEAVHIEIQTAIMETIEHDILNVSKSVAYQKYKHYLSLYSNGKYTQSPSAGYDDFTLYLGGSTILWLKDIIRIIY